MLDDTGGSTEYTESCPTKAPTWLVRQPREGEERFIPVKGLQREAGTSMILEGRAVAGAAVPEAMSWETGRG